MRAPRFTIRTLVFATALVALDFALSKAVLERRVVVSFWALSSFSTINILAIIGYRNLTRGSARRPFFLGFATFGAISLAIWLNCCARFDEVGLGTLNDEWDPFLLTSVSRFFRGLFIDYGFTRLYQGIGYVACVLAYVFTVTAIPHLAIAVAGGWLAVGLARALRRRQASARPVP